MGELLVDLLELVGIEVVWINGSRPDLTGMRPWHV